MKHTTSKPSPESHPPEALLALLATRFAPWWSYYVAVDRGQAIQAIRRTFRPDAPTWLEAVEDSAIWTWTAKIDGCSWEPLVQPLDEFVSKHGANWDKVSFRRAKDRHVRLSELVAFFEHGYRS